MSQANRHLETTEMHGLGPILGGFSTELNPEKMSSCGASLGCLRGSLSNEQGFSARLAGKRLLGRAQCYRHKLTFTFTQNGQHDSVARLVSLDRFDQ